MTTAGQELTVRCPDGWPLAAALYEAERPRGCVVLINSAMGVKQAYYGRYAAFLAEQGFHVLTYDYRGIGGSRTGPLREQDVALWQWAALDQTAMIDHARELFPGQRLYIIGHSVGGQIVGLTPQHKQVAGLLGVAAQSGYWRNWPGLRRLLLLWLWYLAIPLSCAALGYMPAALLGGGESVPRDVALEWARSGRRRGYVLDFFRHTPHNHFHEVHMPMLLFSFADDSFAPAPTVAALARLYPGAAAVHEHISPADVGGQAIGHFGFFRRQFTDTLWQRSLDWLLEGRGAGHG